MHASFHSLLQVEWVPLAGLEALAPQWHDLARRALEPNVFYEPAFALAAAPAFGHGVGVGLVWSGSASRRLMGLFPAHIEGRRYGVPLRMLVGWTHPFAPLGTPLVDRELAQPTLAAWLDHVAADPGLPKLALWPLVPQTGPFAAALAAVLARSARRSAVFGAHRRAMLAPARPDAAYLDRALGGKKRKELRRQRKRLADLGELAFVSATQPDEIADALVGFLTLEASGWKGRRGSAAAAHDATREFMTRAVMGLAAEGKAAVHRLTLEDHAVASAIALRSGGTSWFWKIAYDETLARFSPGVLLAAALTDRLVAGAEVPRVDSCAAPEHPMIDHLWRERLPLGDQLIAARPGAASFVPACRLEAARRVLIAAAKGARNRLRRR